MRYIIFALNAFCVVVIWLTPATFHNDHTLFLDSFVCLTIGSNALVAGGLRRPVGVLVLSFLHVLYCLGTTASWDEVGYEEMRLDLVFLTISASSHQLLQAVSSVATLLILSLTPCLYLWVLYTTTRKHFFKPSLRQSRLGKLHHP